MVSITNYQPDYSLQTPQQDNQLLFNGRVWRSQYYNIRGNEFLFSTEFLQGRVTINEKTFDNVQIKYDLFNDEIIAFVNLGTFVQLNKEMVNGFDIMFNNTEYKFTKITGDSLNSPSGYVNILYQGASALYLKFDKEIKELAVENKYDEFYQRQHLYLLKDGIYYHITGKKDMFNILKDKRLQIKDLVKQKKIKIRIKKPESFIPVLELYDSLVQ